MGPSHTLGTPGTPSDAPTPEEAPTYRAAAAVRGSVGAGVRRSWVEWYVWPKVANLPAPTIPVNGVPESATALQRCTVVVLGLGAVGAIVLRDLARLGVGTLIGIDLDHYGVDSWVTQQVRRVVDTGRSKAELQGARAHAINPAVQVITAKGLAQYVPLWVFRRADLILIAADNLEVLVWAGTRAAELSKPLIQGAVHGESWLALVRCFDLVDASRACPGCALGQREWFMLRSRVGCDPNALREQGIEPTRTLSCVCGTAAHLLVGEALKWLFPIERQRLAGEELAYCLRSHKVWRTGLARNPACRCPHTRWDLVDVGAAPADVTFATLIDQSQGSNPLVQGELPWVSFTVCPSCARYPLPVRRFGRQGETVGRCRCGEPLIASPTGLRSVLPSEDLSRCRDLPLSHLGLPSGSAVGISRGDHGSYYFLGDPELPAMSQPAERDPRDPKE